MEIAPIQFALLLAVSSVRDGVLVLASSRVNGRYIEEKVGSIHTLTIWGTRRCAGEGIWEGTVSALLE